MKTERSPRGVVSPVLVGLSMFEVSCLGGALAEMEQERGLLSAGAVGEDAADDGSNAPPAKRAKSEHEQPALNPNAKRKVVLLVAYNGAGYSGLQKNPDVVTVEHKLEEALHKAGAISDDNRGTLQKISWSRSGRTDKGVHALGQVISCKLILSPEGLIERVNNLLSGTGISVLGLERVSNNFCAHTMCSSREYEYLLPARVLRTNAITDGSDHPPGCGANADAPLSEEESARLLNLFKSYEGTHFFHNFADGKIAHTDGQARRYMMELTLGEPLTLQGVAFVSFRLHGQSFMLHQIRKMIAMVCAVFRGTVPSDAIAKALTLPKVPSIPLAPSCSLTLRRALYANYERRRPLDRASVHFAECEGAQQAFLAEHILPHVGDCLAGGEFTQFVAALDAYQMTTAAPSVAPTQKKPEQAEPGHGEAESVQGQDADATLQSS